MNDLKQQVYEALINATENGYDFLGWTAQAIVDDIKDCDAGLQDERAEDIVPHVVSFFLERGRELS